MNHLALIGTPGHYFNLMECLAQLRVQKKSVHLVMFCLDGDRKTYDFLQSRIIQEEWGKVEAVPIWNKRKGLLRTAKNLFHYLRFCRRQRNKNYDTVIANQYDVIYQLSVVNTIKYRRLISMDEGNAVFRVIKERKENLKEPNKRERTLFNLLGLSRKEPAHITFFSAYDIGVPECDQLINCEYVYSQSLLKEKGVDNSVSFIGSPYANDNILSEEEHYKNMQILKQYYKGRKIRYYPHRREKKEFLHKYQVELDFIIHENELPFEIAFFEEEKMSSEIAGFCSAALFNISQILSSQNAIKVSTFGMNYDALLKPELKETYQSLYQLYIENGIEYITLEKFAE